MSPLRGEKPQNRPLSKLNTSRLALRAMLLVIITRRTVAVHTSAKARLTSAAIRRISMNECPLTVSVSPNSDESGKQSPYPDGDTDRHQNLTMCSLAHCQPSLKFHANLFGSFCAKLLTNRQTSHQRRLHILLEGGNKKQLEFTSRHRHSTAEIGCMFYP